MSLIFYIYRRLHLIPDVDIAFENFENFIRAREQLVLDRLSEILGPQLEPGTESALEAATDGD